jgi:two-component sensor histidine kinase
VNTDLIKTNLEVNCYELRIESAIPAGLIINELVSNALKNAFKDKKSEIKVILDKEDETIP